MSPRCSRRIRWAFIIFIGLWTAVTLAVIPAHSAEPARITVKLDPLPDGALQVTAIAVDPKGTPAAGAPIVVKLRTVFGRLPIAKVSADEAGRIQVKLPSGLRSGEVTAESIDDEEVRATVLFGKEEFAAPTVRPGRDALSGLSPQPGFISPRPVPLQVALLAVLLGGVWTTYGYVVWLLSRIRTE